MKNILLLDSKNINVCQTLQHYTKGKFRFIVKCRAGFLTVFDCLRDIENERFLQYPETIVAGYKPGSLHTVQFQPEGSDYWLTVFAKKGKNIPVIDELILANLTVGTINSYWLNTALYNQYQYRAVGANNWASKAFVANELEAVAV